MHRTVPQRIADRALEHRQQLREPPLELFDVEWDIAERPRPRQRGDDLARAWRWIRRHQLPAQVVLVLGVVTIGYALLVLGLLLGAGIAPWLAP
jgi:hypothetical protein